MYSHFSQGRTFLDIRLKNVTVYIFTSFHLIKILILQMSNTSDNMSLCKELPRLRSSGSGSGSVSVSGLISFN